MAHRGKANWPDAGQLRWSWQFRFISMCIRVHALRSETGRPETGLHNKSRNYSAKWMSGESIRNKRNTQKEKGEKERRDQFNAASLVTTTIRTRLVISRLSTCNSYSVGFKCRCDLIYRRHYISAPSLSPLFLIKCYSRFCGARHRRKVENRVS